METNKENKVFYRYRWQEYPIHDYDGDLILSDLPNPKLELLTYYVIKETKSGYWIGLNNIPFKWIRKNSKRSYAYSTKEDALQDFIERTKKRIKILERQIDCCKICISLAERIKL